MRFCFDLFFDLKGKQNDGEYENVQYVYVIRFGSALQVLKTTKAYFQSPLKSKVVYQLT